MLTHYADIGVITSIWKTVKIVQLLFISTTRLKWHSLAAADSQIILITIRESAAIFFLRTLLVLFTNTSLLLLTLVVIAGDKARNSENCNTVQ